MTTLTLTPNVAVARFCWTKQIYREMQRKLETLNAQRTDDIEQIGYEPQRGQCMFFDALSTAIDECQECLDKAENALAEITTACIDFMWQNKGTCLVNVGRKDLARLAYKIDERAFRNAWPLLQLKTSLCDALTA